MKLSKKMAWLTARAPADKPAEAPTPEAPTPATPPAPLSHGPPAARAHTLPRLSGGALGMFHCPGLNATVAEETCTSTRAAGKLKACDECGAWPGAPKPAPAAPPVKAPARAKK